MSRSRLSFPTPTTRPRRRRSRPLLERLEARSLLAADAGWAFGVGGPSDDAARAIAVDSSGDAYVTGFFRGTVDFDPTHTNSAAVLTSGGGGADDDIFVAEYSPAGACLWARHMIASSNSGYNAGNGITIYQDPVTGVSSVYVVGQFSDTVDFSGDGSGLNRTGAGGSDVFAMKLDGATGQTLWVDAFGGAGWDGGHAIAVDANGEAYATGWFTGTASFGPGTTLSATGTSNGSDVFVAKLGSADGHTAWVEQAGGSVDDAGYAIATYQDSSGTSLALTGFFSATAGFGPVTLTAASSSRYDAFVWRLNAGDGATQWAVRMGGAGDDVGLGVAFDASGDVVASGYFNAYSSSYNGTADFGPYTLTSAGSSDAFVTKLSPAGGFLWARQMGGGGFDIGGSVAAEADGHIDWAGFFSGQADFDPGPGVFSLSSAGGTDFAVSRLDASGNFVAAWRMGGPLNDGPNGLDTPANLAVYQDPATGTPYLEVASRFQGTADFPSGTTLTSAGGYDAFVAKINTQLGALAGSVFNDLNDDGVNDEVSPLQGWTVFLDQNQNGILDQGEVSTTTDSQGRYAFGKLAPGTYSIGVVPRSGFTETAPAAGAAGTYTANGPVGRVVTVGLGESDGQDFGEYTTNQVRTYSNKTAVKLSGGATITSKLTVPDSYTIYDVDVQLNISQGSDLALAVTLAAPDGTVVPLFTDVGGSGKNFTNTTLDDAAAVSISAGTAPFTGTFQPLSSLYPLDGKNVQGTWTLSLTELRGVTGKNALNGWSLVVTGPKSGTLAAMAMPARSSSSVGIAPATRTGPASPTAAAATLSAPAAVVLGPLPISALPLAADPTSGRASRVTFRPLDPRPSPGATSPAVRVGLDRTPARPTGLVKVGVAGAVPLPSRVRPRSALSAASRRLLATV